MQLSVLKVRVFKGLFYGLAPLTVPGRVGFT